MSSQVCTDRRCVSALEVEDAGAAARDASTSTSADVGPVVQTDTGTGAQDSGSPRDAEVLHTDATSQDATAQDAATDAGVDLGLPDADTTPDATVPTCIDQDGDSYGVDCAAGPDCDDTDATIYRSQWAYPDLDLDGHTGNGGRVICIGANMPVNYSATLSVPQDCDDAESRRYPGRPETCDGLDNNCNFHTDEGTTCPCDLRILGANPLHPYLFCRESERWTTARNACPGPYQLVVLNDAAEIAALRSILLSIGGSWWIGLHDRTVEGSFGWIDGSALSDTNWNNNEPNNSGNEDCVETNSSGWNDENCGDSRWYICESP